MCDKKEFPINLLEDIDFNKYASHKVKYDDLPDAMTNGIDLIRYKLNKNELTVLDGYYKKNYNTWYAAFYAGFSTPVFERARDSLLNKLRTPKFIELMESGDDTILDYRCYDTPLSDGVTSLYFDPKITEIFNRYMYYDLDDVVKLVQSPGWYKQFDGFGPKTAKKVMNKLLELGLINKNCLGFLGIIDSDDNDIFTLLIDTISNVVNELSSNEIKQLKCYVSSLKEEDDTNEEQ